MSKNRHFENVEGKINLSDGQTQMAVRILSDII